MTFEPETVVPVIALKPRVIEELRLAQEDVPLITRSDYLTPAGLMYLVDRIMDPEDPRTDPSHFYRKSWREGLTTTPTRE